MSGSIYQASFHLGGMPFTKPSERVSSAGSLQTRVEVRMAEFQLDWLNSTRRLYDGTFPGPTIRIKAGDRVQMDLVYGAMCYWKE